jgi:prepilin-type N-terminal cleavage/methylation domain-containing protein/prepilin-type processing-associated H-X9-DG protein
MRGKQKAFTLVEMLVVVAIIGILAGLLLPALAKGKMRAQQIQCVSNLKQIGVAFHSFLHDHNSLLPMEVSTNDGGTLEYVYASYAMGGQFYFQYRHFQALSNELAMPAVLVCPSDRDRLVASNFYDFNNLNVSYFVGANADYSLPNSMLAGDRNLTNGVFGSQTIVRLQNGNGVYWTGEMHQFRGNILYADGRVEELNSSSLALAGFGAPSTMDLVGPSLRNPGGTPPSGSPPLTPPSNLQPPPSVMTSPQTGRSSSGGGGTGAGNPGSYTGYAGGSRSTRQSGATTRTTYGDMAADGRSNHAAVMPLARTNIVVATNEPAVVVAESTPDILHAHGHWPWWFWLWLLLLLLAAEGTRRYYLRLRKERLKAKKSW